MKTRRLWFSHCARQRNRPRSRFRSGHEHCITKHPFPVRAASLNAIHLAAQPARHPTSVASAFERPPQNHPRSLTMRRMQAIFTNASAEEGSTLRVPAQSSRLAHLAFQNRSNQSSLRQDLKRIGNQNTGKTGLPRVESRISAYRRVLCRNQTSTAYWKKDLSFATFLKKPSPLWRQAVQMWNTASVEGRVSKY